ncbi:esterase [Geodermatophilus sp. Leaf369]|uniref:alpha/beta hydrolase n=1 Tax=Geodermatophilus sp. Leaf369 TaxID=1736354 RepID=UPI0006F277B6|nr:alpha/beta hydrolase [Geodermatophilus sp. Leaf369]KQS54772.1 esterase [Geodermatophilus sp. Leaf369]
MTSPAPRPAPAHLSEQAQAFLANPRPDSAVPAPEDLEAWAAQAAGIEAYFVSMFAGMPLPVTETETQIGSAHVYVLQPDGLPEGDTGPLMLNVHGGGLVYGGGRACALTGAVQALSLGMTTWSLDYRMAPQHPYPAGLDDAMAAYRAMLEVRDPADLFISGGSAGANIAAALLVRAKDEGLPMPAAAVLTTPEVDLTESGDTFTVLDGVDNMLGSLMPVNLMYADGNDLAHPYLSPLFADLTGFPPTFLQSGTRDLFLSNTVRFHRALLAAGVPTELHVFEAMPHGGFGGSSPEDADLSATVRTFVDAHRRG